MQPELPLEAISPSDTSDKRPEGASENGPREPTFGRRVTSAVLDLAVHLGALGAAIGGCWFLGVPPNQLSFLPMLLLIGCFSFVYHVLPLTFWGHTPGMARVGLVARSLDGGPLTIAQAVRRWLGALLNVACLGLLFALSRQRSVSDLLSRSRLAVN